VYSAYFANHTVSWISFVIVYLLARPFRTCPIRKSEDMRSSSNCKIKHGWFCKDKTRVVVYTRDERNEDARFADAAHRHVRLA
jgi:hypothetical protein